jgi:hypothetical protein
MQLGGTVVAVRTLGWRIVTLPYAGADHTGIELNLQVVTADAVGAHGMSDTEDFSEVRAALAPRVVGRLAGDVLAGAERQIGDDVLEAVRSRARRHRKSGQMERRIRLKVTGDGADQVVRIHAGGKVAHLVIGGTRPHRIVAPARPIPLGGRSFAQSVRHPGTRPDPFFAAAVDGSAPRSVTHSTTPAPTSSGSSRDE